MELSQKYKVTIEPFVLPIVLAIAKIPVVDEEEDWGLGERDGGGEEWGCNWG